MSRSTLIAEPSSRPRIKIRGNGSVPVKLFVRRSCPFSPIAIERTQQFALEDERIRLSIIDADTQPRGSTITPVLVLPNGARVTGTPSLERLRSVLGYYYGELAELSNKVWFLERSRLFRGIPREEIEKFAHLFRETDYAAGQVVFHEGDLGDAIYLLKTGHVRLYRVTEEGREATLAVLGPGDVFGELALFAETERTTVAESLDDTHICAASVDAFTALMGRKPQLTMMVAREIARRRQATETRLAGTAFATVRGRVIEVLRSLAADHGEQLPDGSTRITLRFSHQQIASFAGAARESCSVEIGRLQQAGIIRVDATHHFIVPDVSRLRSGAIDSLLRRVLREP
jgi:CRP/FNR family cyclic AMP-dependent transcriptional regulator